MKKFLLFILSCITVIISVSAEHFPDSKYKNIKNNEKVSYDSSTNIWSNKINKKTENYFIKTKGFGDFYDYLDSNKNYAFTTECEYEFIYNNSLIGYSNRDMKFYEISYINGGIGKRELLKEEVQKIFPNYTIIELSDFTKSTNVYKIKKHIGELKIILLNNSTETYDNFHFTSGNAKFTQYDLRGFLTVSKPGMIQFSSTTDNNSIWYVLLVR